MLQVEIIYPQQDSTVYSDELKFRYKVLNNLEKYKLSKIVFIVNDTEEITTTVSNEYTFDSLKSGTYEIKGYLLNKNNIKIDETDFSVKFNVVTEKFESKNPTWSFAKTKLPQFIQEDYKTFSRFIEAYYEWLHKSNNPIFAPFTSEQFADVDTTPEVFLSNFRIQYLNDFPDNILTSGDKNIKTIIKNIKQFYRSKGSEKSFRFLFRLLYNTYVDFYYPRTDLIKGSGNLWVENVGMKVKNIELKTAFLLKNSLIYQLDASGNITASARVVEVSVQRVTNMDLIELFVANVVGEFDGDKQVYSDILIDGKRKQVSMDLLPVVTSVDITSKALRVGDPLYLLDSTDSISGTGFYAVVQEVDFKGKVKRLQIIDSGYNYSGTHLLHRKNENGSYTPISGTYEIGVMTRYPGYYKTISSSPSSRGKLHDNRKYQELSYVLKVEENIINYADIVKRLVHPAGVGLFGSYLVKRDEQIDVNSSTTTNLYYQGFIGNYLPYTFNTIKNLRNDSYPDADPILYPSGMTDLYPSGFDPNQTIPDEDEATQEHIPSFDKQNDGVTDLVFTYIPDVSDKTQINDYWVVFPNPNTLLNNSDTIKDIVIRDFLRIPITDLTQSTN
jgi:hypothetical protein